MAKKSNKGKIAYVLQSISILPLLLLGIVILLLGTRIFTNAMYREVERDLGNVCSSLSTAYDALYPGDYTLTDGKFRKGSRDISADFSLIDSINRDTGLEITLFFQNTRMLTTIRSSSGARIIGSSASPAVMEDVFETGIERFYHNVPVNGVPYFAYYLPLRNSDGTVAGMLFVGRPTEEVDASVSASIYPLVVADIFFMLLVSCCIFLYTRSFTSALLQIHRFLRNVSAGNLSAAMPDKVLGRNDELSEIARSVLNMQRSLRNLVEQDALTALSNRRSGDMQLRQIVKSARAEDRDFCVAIGDIDDFKKVNDTYGHDCGDLVLKHVAEILQRNIRGSGFVARWGGEEFLLVFDNMDSAGAERLLENVLTEIRSLECRYDDTPVHVTMTFGLTAGNSGNVTDLLRAADERLYIGKKSGKNRVVSVTDTASDCPVPPDTHSRTYVSPQP